MNLRSIGIGDGRSQIAYDRVACVFKAHGGVFGPFEGLDGVLESRLLEGHVPVFHALYEVFAPLFGRGRVDVVDDGLLGFHQFATPIALHVLVFRLQSPSHSDALVLHLLLVVAVDTMAVGKISHARVERSLSHGLLWQHDKRCVEPDGHPSCLACCGNLARSLHGKRLHGLNLRVDRECTDVVDV